MREKIGKVVLDYRYYPGVDLYSDGQVEDELLDIAKNYSRSEFNKIIDSREKWPLLYHFSHIRENIVSWLPINKNDKVLEIGSGCGAVTGALAKKAGKVTCVDLSKKRSLVNAYRHKDYDNIEILVGNFQDIEKNLEETFDYITLIGVFEYSEGYIGTEDPYVDMLKIISRHLSEHGKIILAIENKMGLKYWAGCTEDHTGLYFEGLEGYTRSKGVRTFTRKELEEMFSQAGISSSKFYYPYPDYKFPMSVFSDKWLPAEGDLREINYNYDRERIRLFNETNVYNTVLKEGLFPIFSNSYLAVLQKEKEEEKESCIYIKYSNERAEEFSIRTEIHEGVNGERKVYKLAECSKGEKHLKNILQSCKRLGEIYADTPIEMNRCISAENGIELEYVTGSTLENILDEMLLNHQEQQLKETFIQYLDILQETGKIRFSMTDDFKQVFGNVDIPGEELCPEYTNLDPVCGNILFTENKWVMLDYEWSFSFPIPVKYQIYRVIKYYLYTSASRGKAHELDLFAVYNIGENEKKVFEVMEENFQKYILGAHIPIRHMYDKISPGTLLDIQSTDFLGNLHNSKTSRIYFDRGTDFKEEDSRSILRQKQLLKKRISLPSNIKRVRLDPCEQPCIVKVIKFEAKMKDGTVEPVRYEANGTAGEEGFYGFQTEDPYFVSHVLPKDVQAIDLEIEIYPCQTEVGNFVENSFRLTRERDLLRADIQKLEYRLDKALKHIQAMENTKIWKLYKTIKKD